MLPGPSTMVPTPHRVRRRQRENSDCFTLELEAGAGHGPTSSPRPGQFNMLYVFGVGEVPISVSGSSADGKAVRHTIRDVGAVTHALAGLRRDDVLGVRGPFGSAWPLEAALGRDVVFVAGGIGLAPLRPAIEEVAASRARFGRVLVLYGARSPEGLLLGRDLERWRTRFDIEVLRTVDHAGEDWTGRVGVVPAAVQEAVFDPHHSLAMICGPELMIRFTVQELLARGVGQEDIHVSLERNMKCAIGICGHCQLGPSFVCKEGPVYPWPRVAPWLSVAEL